MPPITTPKFANEAEEAEWLDANRDLLTAELGKAAAEGRLSRRGAAGTVGAGSQGLALSDEQLLKAHEAAQRRGLKFSEYLTLLVTEGLEREAA